MIDVLRFLHVLVLAAWAAGDASLQVALRALARADGAEQGQPLRALLLRVLPWPRLALVLVLPTGYSLALALGLAAVPLVFVVALWVLTALWLAAVWIAAQPATGRTLRRVAGGFDFGWSLTLAFGLAWDAWQGFRGAGHLLVPWVSAKFLVLALVLLLGAGQMHVIRRQLAAAAVAPSTVTPGRLLRWQLPIWALLLVAAWLGIARPSF